MFACISASVSEWSVRLNKANTLMLRRYFMSGLYLGEIFNVAVVNAVDGSAECAYLSSGDSHYL